MDLLLLLYVHFLPLLYMHYTITVLVHKAIAITYIGMHHSYQYSFIVDGLKAQMSSYSVLTSSIIVIKVIMCGELQGDNY